MMDAFDLASRLFGNSRAESRGDVSNSLDILTATGAGDSSDGAATVYLDADMTPADDYDGDDYAIGIPTAPNVIEGDGVLVGLTGSGPLKTPVVISNPGSGDRMQAQVDSAEALAQQAEDVAQEAAEEVEQVRQDVADFRDDVATTYATKVEREDGDDAVKTWVTTNYTNSNDLATTYATKTLVSQTKDAIELAASQTYETQSDAAATYATKAALTVGLDGIRSEVAEDYQPKGDYATTASMNSAIQQSASSIESSVAATYETKSDAAATYATKTEVQQTAAGLDTRIMTAQSTADGAYLERTATGTTIDTTGAATIRSLVVEGQSVQDGTPSPSAPVPIVSVESRNLLPVYSATTVNGITFTVDGSGAVTANGTASATVNHYVLLTVPETGAYVMSGCPAGGSASTYQLWTYDTTTPRDQQLTDTGSGATGTLTEGHIISVRIRIQSGYTATDLTFRPMLERGSTAHPYQPYGCVTLVAGNSRTDIDLQGHALRSLPDGTHDEMRVDSLGRVTLTQRVGSKTFSGTTSEIWSFDATKGGRIVVNTPDAAPVSGGSTVHAVFSNRFAADTYNNVVAGTTGKVAQRINLTSNQRFAITTGDSTITSVNLAAAWLASNQTTIIYPLATPQTINLGTIDLPTPADTLWLDAALVPTIEATWWTVDGIAGQQALDAEVTERQTLIRQFGGGVLAGYVGNAIAALVNAAGSFDVVLTAWTDGVPSILGTLARYAASGISLFDAAGNVLAEFASDHVRIGGSIPEDGSAVATVRFFDSDADKGAMVEGYVSNSYSPTDEDVGWGVQTQDTYTDLHTSTNDSDMEQVNGCAGTADVRLGQTTYWEDGPDGYYQAESTATLTATADSGTDPTQTAHASASLGVKAVTVNDSAEEAYLTVNGNDVPMEQAIAVLSSPVTLFTGTYAQTHSAAVTLSETASNFSRLMFVCENDDGERTSVTVTDPNGKHFNVVMLTIAGPSGTGTYAYMKAKSFSINGTSVTCRTYTYNGQTIYRHGSVTLRNGVAVAATQASEEIGIVKVLGWR